MTQLHKALKRYGKGSLYDPRILRAVFKGEWKNAKDAKKEKEKKQADDKDKHAVSNGELTAVLWKDSSYNNNTYKHLKGDKGRNKVFSTFKYVDEAYGAKPWMPGFIRKYFKFPGAMNCNFNPNAELKGKKTSAGNAQTAGQRYPYRWEAHHMIPASAFYTEKKNKNGPKLVFTPTQYALLLMSDYDVNNGHNMIPLPTNGMDYYQPVHAMIQHPSDHQNYTSHVQDEMSKISEDLKDLEDELKEDHPSVSVMIASELAGVEDDLWDLLIKLGDKIVKAQLKNSPPELSDEEQKMVSKQSKTGTTYTYGALV